MLIYILHYINIIFFVKKILNLFLNCYKLKGIIIKIVYVLTNENKGVSVII